MNGAAPSLYVPKAFPLRYWFFVLYCVGMPSFTRFDVTGRTHVGIFNAQSISSIALTVGVGYLFFTVVFLSRSQMFARRVTYAKWLWLSLLFFFVLGTIMEPSFRTTLQSSTDLYLSLYRLGEWVLAFVMFLALYSREPLATSTALAADLIARICWISIGIVWAVFCFAPSYAYSSYAEFSDSSNIARLGGVLIAPAVLADLASLAVFHALIYLKGLKRIVALFVSLLTLVLTYGRTEEIIFVISIMVYFIFFARGASRILGFVAGFIAVVASAAYSTSILAYMQRGHGSENITTLSERTFVWQAAGKAFLQRPYFGYGFIAGVKSALKDQWTFAHWVPAHAHNDWIQAALSGGILAACILFWLYAKALLTTGQMAFRHKDYLLFFFAVFPLSIAACLGPLMAHQIRSTAAIFMISFIVATDARKLRGQTHLRRGAVRFP